MASLFLTRFQSQTTQAPASYKTFSSQQHYQTTAGSGYKDGEIWHKVRSHVNELVPINGKPVHHRVEEYAKGLLSQCAPGFYGDAVEVVYSPISGIIHSATVYQKEFKLIKEATDCVIMVAKKINGEIRFFGLFGKRLNPPGAGQDACIGGFNDKKLDSEMGVDRVRTPFETAINESREEAGFKIIPDASEKMALKDPNTDTIKAKLHVKGSKVDATMYYCGIQPTGIALMKDGGERSVDGVSMRVDRAYCVLVIPDNVLEEQEDIFAGAKAGDDIGQLVIRDLTPVVQAAETLEQAIVEAEAFTRLHKFGINHHAGVIARAACVAYNHFLRQDDDDMTSESSGSQ